MKNRKVAGPSGVVAEMLKAAPDICFRIIADLMNAIIRERKFAADWSDSIVDSLFKGKRDGFDQNNYHGLKFRDHVLKRLLKEWSRTSYVKLLILMKCSLAFGPVETQQMQFLFLTASREVSHKTQETVAILYLSIWKRPLIECLERYCGGLFVLLVYLNG